MQEGQIWRIARMRILFFFRRSVLNNLVLSRSNLNDDVFVKVDIFYCLPAK